MHNGLHHFAHRLVLFHVSLVDYVPGALSNLRRCVNVERLGVTCHEGHRGDLHEVLDLLRYFPKLEHLALKRLDAATASSPAEGSIDTVYIPPSRLTHLSLYDVGGEEAGDLLLLALDPERLVDLTSLELKDLGDDLSFSLISAYQHTLSSLAYEVDVSDGAFIKMFSLLNSKKGFEPLLPPCPFPALRQVTVAVTPVLHPLEIILALDKRADALLAQRGGAPVTLSTLAVVDVPWSPSDLFGARILPTKADVLELGREPSQAELFMASMLGPLSKAFDVGAEGRHASNNVLGLFLEPFEPEVVLEKGREVRRIFGEEDEEDER